MDYFVEIKFERSNKFYNFSCDTPDLLPGDKVVVETVRGVELGEVARKPQPMEIYKSTLELKPIKRPATKVDLDYYRNNLAMAKDAEKIFIEQVTELKLPMRFIDATYTLDGTKCIFTYVSEDRIDFRDLLKILAGKLKCKIELRQIGSRDKAMLYGGLGPCGRAICCSVFLTEFNGISINKAKNQMLTLNIPKLTGQCGKLMCCLNFENEAYDEIKSQFPEVGTKFMINEIEYTINSFNIFTKVVKCTSREGDIFLPLNDLLDEMNGTKKPAKPQQKVEFSKIDEEKSHSHKKENKEFKENKPNKNKDKKFEKKEEKALEKSEKKEQKQVAKEDKKQFKSKKNFNNKNRNFKNKDHRENSRENSQNPNESQRFEHKPRKNFHKNNRKFQNKNKNNRVEKKEE